MFRRLGGMWLMHLAHQVIASDEPASLPHRVERVSVPIDSWSHTQSFVLSTEYRAQISWLAHEPSVALVAGVPFFVTKIDAPQMSKSRREMESLLQSLGPRSVGVVVSQPYLKISAVKRLRAIVASRRVIRWDDLDSRAVPVAHVDGHARRSISTRVAGNDLVDKLHRIIPLVMPVAMSEGLPTAMKNLLPSYERPRFLYSANGSQLNLPYQVVSSAWGAEGTRILSHQHGGHQGLDEIHAGEECEIRASDVHYSLGWTDDRPNVKVLPAAMPSRARVRTAGRLLLMTLADTDVVYRLQPFCVPSHVQRCASETRGFLSELRWPTTPIVRGSRRDIDALRLDSHFDSEGFQESGSKSASASSLVVHNYLGVTWLESLAMNVPTVCFIPTGIHAFRSAAQPFVDRLQQVGILHHSGREAAKFVNGFRGDPSWWWKSAEVQEAREAFVARYANFSDDWLAAWQAEFESLLEE
jgi:putative transferase (TIGR04331 family)